MTKTTSKVNMIDEGYALAHPKEALEMQTSIVARNSKEKVVCDECWKELLKKNAVKTYQNWWHRSCAMNRGIDIRPVKLADGTIIHWEGYI